MLFTESFVCKKKEKDLSEIYYRLKCSTLLNNGNTEEMPKELYSENKERSFFE
jgi:hypothetical protein